MYFRLWKIFVRKFYSYLYSYTNEEEFGSFQQFYSFHVLSVRTRSQQFCYFIESGVIVYHFARCNVYRMTYLYVCNFILKSLTDSSFQIWMLKGYHNYGYDWNFFMKNYSFSFFACTFTMLCRTVFCSNASFWNDVKNEFYTLHQYHCTKWLHYSCKRNFIVLY